MKLGEAKHDKINGWLSVESEVVNEMWSSIYTIYDYEYRKPIYELHGRIEGQKIEIEL